MYGIQQNPETPYPPLVQGVPKPQYPKEKQEHFMGCALITARDPSLLDYKDCGILLTSARMDIASARPHAISPHRGGQLSVTMAIEKGKAGMPAACM